MVKVVDKRYPESGTYQGKAVECRLDGTTLPFVDIADKIIEYVESEVEKDGAKMLSLEVWEWHVRTGPGASFVRKWIVVFRAYGGSIQMGLAIPWVVVGVILALLIAMGVVLYFVLTVMRDIVYVFTEPLPVLALIVGAGGLTFLGYLIYKTLKERRVGAIPA